MGNEFKITPKDGHYTIEGSETLVSQARTGILVSRKELLEALAKLPDRGNFEVDLHNQILIQKNKEKNTAKDKKENYKRLQPAGFEYASQMTKDYRKTLENNEDVKQMEYLKSIVSYNTDGTMNSLPLKKTFCKNISGQNTYFTYAEAKKIEEENKEGYTLMTDYNDTDSEEEQRLTDFYKIISLFNLHGEIGRGDSGDANVIFRNMSGCDYVFWTKTPLKDLNGEITDEIIVRLLYDYGHGRFWVPATANNKHSVCGRKDME